MDSAVVIDGKKLLSSVPTELVEWIQSLREHVQGLESENANLREKVQQLTKTVGELRDEIAALKGQKGRPVIKPSGMDKQTEAEENEDEKGQGRGKGKNKSDKGAKTARLVIHEERKVEAENVPQGSRFLGYSEFTVQELKISTHNTRLLLERWSTPDGRVLTASCPSELINVDLPMEKAAKCMSLAAFR